MVMSHKIHKELEDMKKLSLTLGVLIWWNQMTCGKYTWYTYFICSRCLHWKFSYHSQQSIIEIQCFNMYTGINSCMNLSPWNWTSLTQHIDCFTVNIGQINPTCKNLVLFEQWPQNLMLTPQKMKKQILPDVAIFSCIFCNKIFKLYNPNQIKRPYLASTCHMEGFKII